MDKKILTGQFVCIEQMPAKTLTRFFGLVIDWAVLVAYVFSVISVFDYLDIRLSTTLLLLFVALPFMLYQPVCEWLTGGQTLGKFLLKMRVARSDGGRASLGDVLLRWLLLPIDLMFCGAVAAFSMLVTPRRQRLGDLAAGTMVIKLKAYGKIRVSLDEFRFVQDGYQPTYDEARNLSEAQADHITRTLADRSSSRRHRIEQLARELRRELEMPDEYSGHEQFLTTLLSDYRYFDLNTI